MKNKSVKLKIRINDLSKWILFAAMRKRQNDAIDSWIFERLSRIGGSSGIVVWEISGALSSTQRNE